MALRKAEVEKYISKIESRLNTPHERNLKGLAFAELYRKAGEVELAKRYTLAYISTNSNDYRGHKILGELLEDGQDYHKALESYKRSFAINSDQNDVLLKIVKLYTELRIDEKIAKAWADHASKRIPGHPAIYDLQVHLIELKKPLDYDELVNLIAEELTQRPHDSSVHAKLVETYMAMDHVEDAYDHCLSVNKTKAFHNNLPWFLMTVAVLERYLNLKETQVKNHSPMSRQSILQEIYIALLTSYCNLVELNLTKSTLRKSSTSLLRLDQLLHQAVNLENGLSNSTDLSEASEWDVAITEIRAQLYMLSGHLLFRLAKEGYSAWSQALEMATACYVTSYRVCEPEMTSPWVAKASSERNPVMWSMMAASRLSQTGHLILATLDRYGEEKINSILLNLCSPQGQEDILTTLYGHNNDFSRLFLSEDESFLTPEFIIPGELMKYDEVFIAENPLNLELIVWIGLHWYQHGQETEPGIEILVGQLFEGLRMDVNDVAQCSADFVCLRDIEAFIYAVIKCSAHGIFEDLDVVYEYYQPKLLPLCLCQSLCIPTQNDWWNAVYTLFTGTVSISSSGKVKMIVQRGLEQIRTLKNQGMHPKLVIHLATNFGQKSLLLKDAAGYSQWYYSTHWKSFQLRSLHYWNVALSLFEDMKRNKNPGCPKDPLFPHNLSHLEDHDVHRYFREACMTLGEAAVEGGDFEQALNLFNRVESSHAAWNEAQIFKHLAGLESSNAGVDDRAYDSYIQYLNEAKDKLLLCLQRLEYDKVVRDAVEEELATIESLMNERKSFYQVDPRKSIDFHQLDFDALKSPVCSDITESGETMALKENDTRELLATVSEVTLDNGFLREQVSIRDEQVLRLSRQVQNLQSELARYKQNGDMSPASFSFPSERTPSPLEDYESSHKVHLESGEKFTRQGTFVNNIVVPTDRCDDPSFFSGLSKSNTPDRIQHVLDEEDEEETDDIYFEPVVQLPSQVEFRSGEEDETVIFEERTKLFRFQDGEWKERGVGNLKLLWNSTSGQARIVMRREKVLKICANHFVTQDMALKPGKGSDRSWVWSTLADVADDESKPQQFAAKFQTKEIAEKFKAKVEELQKKKVSFVPESPAVSPFAANPLATKPTPEHMKMPVLSSNLPYLSSTPNKPAGTTQPGLQSYADRIQTASSVKTPSSDAGASQTSSGVNDAANFWNQIPATSSMPYFQSVKDNSKEPLQAPGVGPEEQSSTAASFPPPFQNTFSFSFGSKPDALENEDITPTSNVVSKNQDESGFSGFGKPVFSVPDNDREEVHDIENEVNIDFKPIVSLPLVKNQATGEEGELTRFSERAKLFRFDLASKEWKERGLGEMKLLYDPSSGKSRVVMRREQIHKICANHFILPTMKLKANTTSNRSWLWYTHADMSDGEPKAEQLAVKFKQEETASEFKKVFEELQSISPSSKASDPDADEDTSSSMLVRPSSIESHFQPNQDLKLQFQPPSGSWPCTTCLVPNSSQTAQCVACQAPKPGLSKQTQQPTFSFAPPSGFSFGSPGDKASTSSNDFTKSGFNSGFTFGSPSFSFQSQPLSGKTTENETLKSGAFSDVPVDQLPFSFPKSNNNVNQASTGSSPFTITPSPQTTSNERNKEHIEETSLKDSVTQSSAPSNNLRLAFQPAEGSWECDTCLVRNSPESNVCAACQTPKPGAQPTSTSSGFNFNTGTTGGFSFGPPDASKDTTQGSGFTFGSSDANKDTTQGSGFSFGSSDVSKDTTQGSGFSFGSSDVSKDTTQGSGFSFGPPDVSKDTTQGSGFSFGSSDVSKDTTQGSGFTFGSSDANKDTTQGSGFSFGSSDVSKDTTQGSGFSFGSSDASKDRTQGSGFNLGPSYPDSGPSYANEAPTVTNDLKLAFQPAEGSWECDTCLVRNSPESNVCAACQTPKPGAQPTSTSSGFNFNTGTPSGFSFGPPDVSKDTTKDSGLTFGSSHVSKDTTQGSGFTFGSSDPSKDTSESSEFSFGPPVVSKDTTQGSGFSFGSSDASEAPTVTNDLKLAFQPAEGSWECDTCLVRNSPESNVCVACQTPKPGAQPTSTSSGFNFNTGTTGGFSFGSSDASEAPTVTNDLKLAFQPAEGSWECDTCLVRNSPESNVCVACQTPKPGAQPTSTSSGFNFNTGTTGGFSFGSSDASEAPTVTNDLKLAFQPAEGSWECDTCLVRNSPESNVCVACQTPKPGAQPTSTSSGFNFNTGTTGGFSFGSSDASEAPTVTNDLKLAFQPAEGSWECDTCLVRNSPESNVCAACQTPKPGAQPTSTSSGFNFNTGTPSGFSFGPPDVSKDTTKDSGLTFGSSHVSKDTTQGSGFTFGSSDPSKDTSESSEFSFGPPVVSKDTTQGSGFSFGSSDASEAPTVTNDLKLAFQPAEGSWECDTCLVRNSPESNVCAACQTAKPGAQPTSTSSGFNFNTGTPSGFSFGSGDEDLNKKSGFLMNPNTTSDDLKKEPPCAEVGSREASKATFSDDDDTDSDETTDSEASEEYSTSREASRSGKETDSTDFTFKGHAGNASSSATSNVAPTSGFTFGKPFSSEFSFGSTPQAKDADNTVPTFDDSKENSSKPVFNIGSFGDASKGFTFGDASKGFSFGGFGSTASTGFNFGGVQTSQSGFNFGGDTSADGVKNQKEDPKEFPKSGDDLLTQGAFTFRLDIPKEPTEPTSPSNKDVNVSEENPEVEDERVVFKPIVSLPSQVDVKTGEEDETTLFSSHAKLYRFTESTWKERGVGEIKVLHDPKRERGRIIMRRDQVHILCANHFIQKNMRLQPQGSSGKSWLWHVQGDFAENEVKEQLFAVKFKDTDSALAFQRAFEECNKVDSLHEDVEEEVIMVYELSVTDDQRARAAKFLLPPNFYAKPKETEGKRQEKLSGVPASSEPTPFIFGSADVTSLSFSSLVSGLGSSHAFGKSSPNKEFTGAGAQLFGQESNQQDDDPEREVSGIDFKPIVQLEKIEQSSGEENEIIIYKQRAKLYRYDKETSQWKERGVGILKLLKHKLSGQIRVLMRRDQILKICANHLLTPEMELKPNAGSDRSWVWHANADISDGEPKAEQLAVRFKNAEIAQEFKEKFDECKDELVNASEKINQSNQESDDTGGSTGFSRNVRTDDNSTSGVYEDEPGEALQPHDELSSTLDTSQHGSSMDKDNERKELVAKLKTLPLSTSSKTPSEQGVSSSQRKTRPSSSSSKSPPREILSSIDEPSPSSEPFMRVNFNFHSIVAAKAIYTGLDEETVNPPETTEGENKVVKELFPDTNISEGELAMKKEDEKPESGSAVVDGGGPVFTFGSGDISALSFASLANQSSAFTNKPSQTKAFLGSGAQLFTSNDEDDPEREVEGTDFKPIVSLPDVKHETGEENETVIYTHRAKLFRYDLDTKQWKERGVGDIKILRHDETKRCRVVMRRDQIHKLCANHYITAAMELKENAGSDRSWMWSADADFADGVAKSELLAVRFKHREDAVMFREKFVECQEKDEIKPTEVSSFEEKPSNDDDDVEIIFEKIPSPEQKKRAEVHLLPQTFYCFEKDSEEEVEKICGEEDAPNAFTQLQQSVPANDDIVPENEENIPVFQFGSKETSTLSFSELAQQASGLPKASGGTWKGFLGSGAQLFTSNDEDDPEREVEGTDFKPIVSLPDVKHETGEENETVIYTHRAKLFRYDLDTKQWKERGVGDIKILRHDETKRCRVVMRRDQIHKLCANHYITAAMELKENAGSDRSWMWSADADFADGVAKSELLAVRFKHREDAVMFREKFVECQEKDEIKPTEVSSFEEKPSNDDDDVEIIFEKIPSPEQKKRAEVHLLPQTFYCFEKDSEEEVEKTCSEEDAPNAFTQLQQSVPASDDIVPENEENIPVFQFGSKETSTLSFSELAQQASGLPKASEGTWKGFLGSGAQLFTSNDEDDPEREVEGADFKPIVSLPDVKHETGEENETVIYTHRAKLFRYDLDTKQWKERGVGDIKILRHDETKRCRVVMRRDQIHKLCANHYITAAMELKENAGSDRSWMWSADADFADGVAKSELLAVRFKHREDAVMFREKFVECQEKDEIKPTEVSSFEEKPSNDDDDVEITFENIPSPEQKERARVHKLPQTFYCSEKAAGVALVRSDVEGVSKEQDAGVSSKLFQDKEESQRKSNETKYKLNIVDESSSSVPENSLSTLQDSASTTTYAHSFVFGSQDISSLSFSALAGKTSGFKSSPNKEFTGAGAQLFGQESNQQDDDPEREVSGIDFKPIVQLEKIEQSSGEENEIIIYKQRAKLYRYDKETSQWKERGVGILKLLKHKLSGQIRVLMRRDQILKICANHLLTPEMELKPNAGSDRSWVWHANADISDGEPKAEQLAVRFKNAEIAQEFKEKFDECKDGLKATLPEKQPEDDKSVYETRPDAFSLTENDLGRGTTEMSTLKVILKQEKLVLPVTGKPRAGIEAVTEKPGALEEPKWDGKTLLVSLHTTETRHILSSRFYTDYLPRLGKQDVRGNGDIQVLFGRDAQVYYFDVQQGDWRERGYGNLQILRYNSEFHIFLLDRARICVAHQIKPSMDLKPNAGSDRSWVWFTLEDHSDFEVVERELAAEFQSVEHLFEFKKMFDHCRDLSGVPHEGHVHAMAASFDSNAHRLPSHHGMSPSKAKMALWRNCSSCKVENSVENASCLVCGKNFTADDRPVVEFMRKPQVKVRPSPGPKKPIPTPNVFVATTSTVEKYKPVRKWWKCLTCGVENNAENTHCPMCSSPKPPKMLLSKISCSPQITKMLDEISKM